MMDFGLSTPFTVALPGSSATDRKLVCEKVLRSLPGKRLACLATWGGKKVFAKFYFDPNNAKRHWLREQAGVRALLDKGILTPELLHASLDRREPPYFLLFRRIAPAHTLDEAWNTAVSDDRHLVLLRLMMAVLATHHCGGLVHEDMHLGNFLLQGEAVYTLDGDHVRVIDTPISKKRALANLGLLFAQLPPQYDRLAGQVFPHYAALRGWSESNAYLGILHAQIGASRERRKNKFMKKIFRECSAFVCRKGTREYQIYDRNYDNPQMRRLLDDPDCLLNSEVCKILKLGNSATVGIVAVGDRLLVIKRNNLKGFWHSLKRAFQRSRASLCWRNAHLLSLYGIATPAPVALIEKRLGLLRRVSYFISEYVPGMDCAHYFNASDDTLAEQAKVAEKIATLVHKLEHSRISHGDMKATNILVSQGEPVLIDLDALRQHRWEWTSKQACARDIRRFLCNWKKGSPLRKLFELGLEKHLLDRYKTL